MLIKGLFIGAVVSAPVGPVGLLCVQRTLCGGKRQGIATACGAAFSDLLYALIAMFSMSIVVDFIEAHQSILQVIGTIVVFLFGLHTFRSDPRQNLKRHDVSENTSSIWNTFSTSFFLTVTNPLVIFLFIFLFAKFHFIGDNISFGSSLLGVGCIMVGAAFWWTLIIYAVDFCRTRFFNIRKLYIVNKVVGLTLMLIAPISLIISFFK